MPSILAIPPVPDSTAHTQTSLMPEMEENMLQQAWHSLEEALHLREPVPPPVPPKDEKWLIKTVDLALPHQEPDPGFWDRIVMRISHIHTQATTEEEEEAVSINVPADAALDQLGIQSSDGDLQDKKDYFKRMAARCKEKFDEDSAQSVKGALLPIEDEDDTQDSVSSRSHHRHRHLRHYIEALHRHLHVHGTENQNQRHAQFVPKIDPKEAKASHRIVYHHRRERPDEDDEEEDRKLFGPWWGWRAKRSRAEKLMEKELDSEWEKIDLPKSSEEKRRSFDERNGALPVGSPSVIDLSKGWWKQPLGNVSTLTLPDKNETRHGQTSTNRFQAIAAAAAYEAVKEYNARKTRQGKKVTHGEMKAILAGIAMAEAVKLLESRLSNGDGDGDSDHEKNEAVAEAGSTALKLFELLR
ncbi:hypothetical protein BGZ58_008320 [Dissophora ornata]|nr:hypothetical protein BGZ58_008320 [Dissophora ornata]